MTPFAAEISRSLSRFMRNKIRINNASKESVLKKYIVDYFAELYPDRVYTDSKALYIARTAKGATPDLIEEVVPIIFSCYFVYHIEKPIAVKGKNVSEVAKILKDSINVSIEKNKTEISAHTITITYSDESKKEIFLDGIQQLQALIQQHSNIHNGFVCFLTNAKDFWKKSPKEGISSSAVEILQNVEFQNVTLFPEVQAENYSLKCFQAVWLPTRNREYNFCLGMNDDAFVRHDYQCRIIKDAKQQAISLSRKKRVPTDVKQKSGPTIEDRFYDMLQEERFIKNSKENWLWDWESAFLNDYSRLMMSPAIRRMKDKTQVFSFEESDFHRVRLTHSLEVANVAKLIGMGVEYTLNKGVDIIAENGETRHLVYGKIKKYHIPQILEVAGLIHDIGNPPFGHFGESTIQHFFRDPSIMHPLVRKQFESLSEQQKHDFINFDGNVQGFRILRHLGLSTDCSSFNLNKVIVCTLVKYPYSSLDGNQRQHTDCRKHKFGFFQMEEDAFAQMQKTLGLEPGQRHPLAYLLEAADDICYMGSDIEDGWKLDYIPAKSITHAFNSMLSPEERNEIFNNEWDELRERIEHPDSVISANAIQALRIRMQRYIVKEVVAYFCKNIERIVVNSLNEDEHELLMNIPTVKKLHDIWNELVQNCYNKIHGAQIQGGQILTALLKCFTETVFCGNLVKYKEHKHNSSEIKGNVYAIRLNTDTKSGMIYETISDNYRYELSPAGQFVPQDAYEKFMLVTDYISGMTDCFATTRYEALMIK